jgi:DNA-binding XRE family transcriptional regulator
LEARHSIVGLSSLNSAIVGLSYDLAVLEANYAIERGLRGEEAMRVFRDETTELLEEVTSLLRASSERLAVTFDDEAEEVKGLAQPFHRVQDDLRRLLHGLPSASKTSESAQWDVQPAAGGGPAKAHKTAFGRNIDRLRKECGWSFDELAKKTGLDKKLTLGHVNEGKGAHPITVKTYAETFARELGRIVTVVELERAELED